MDLISAVRNGDIERVHELLLRYDADPNIRDINGNKILLFASIRQLTEIIILLLQSGADPNTRDIDTGDTPLHEASLYGYTNIVKILLEHNADPNIINGLGSTPLIRASSSGYTNIVRLLLDHNADPNIRNGLGYTALTVAEYPGGDIIARLIRDHIDFQRLQMPQQNLAFMNYFLDRDDLDIDTASRIFGNVRSYNPGVNRRTRNERRSHMMLEDENNRIADFVNTINQYGSGKRKRKNYTLKRY